MNAPTDRTSEGRFPRLLYGTAWKEADTERLTALALEQGFRGIDTANQRRHYDEAAVGQGIAQYQSQHRLPRTELFLQSKFTFRGGQDHRLPYDPQARIATQVEQSFDSTLRHLNTDWLDSYVLHGPTTRFGLTSDDWEAWRAMEAIHDRGVVAWLGVSNVTLQQLQELCAGARIPPRFVQNRCYAVVGWDREIRDFCAVHQMIYQGFSLLTANRAALSRPELAHIAKRHQRTIAQIIFRFALDVGMMPLTGTTNPSHMQADLDIFDFQLDAREIDEILRLGC